MKSSASLWSADLVNLAADIRRVEAYVDEFHLDVCDGHYAPALLFFPDLVAAIGKQTRAPLEVHLIVQHPEQWVGAFAEAGADIIDFYPDAPADMAGLVDEVRARGLRVGISLSLAQSVEMVEPVLAKLDRVIVMGTDVGIKGVNEPFPEAYEKIRRLAAIREERGLKFAIEADGAIRRHTVPLLRQAGADIVVPGSLVFGGDVREVSGWLKGL